MNKENVQTLATVLVIAAVALLAANQLFITNISSETARATASIAALVNSAKQTPNQPVQQGQTSLETSYGVPLSNDGYNQLINDEKTISLSSKDQQAEFTKLIGRDPSGKPYEDHPCCTAAIGECDCGHAVALRGLTKLLIQKGMSEQGIINESLKWNELFFPDQYQQAGSGLGGCG